MTPWEPAKDMEISQRNDGPAGEDPSVIDAGGQDSGVTDAGVAVVVGLGLAGGRVIERVQARLAGERLARAGGLTFLRQDAAASSLCEALSVAVRTQMRQSVISRLESGFQIRRPQHRFLKLTLVYVAALAEVTPETLPACLRAVGALDHPPAGLETLVFLDGSSAESATSRPDDQARLQVLERLRDLERSAATLAEQQEHEWGESGRLRVMLTHPHRADGSWLEPASEFEAALASLLSAHITPGPGYEGLAALSEADVPLFALAGWSATVLPREEILERAARMLAADVLEQTAKEETLPEMMVTADTTGTWQNAQDALLDRRSLLRRLLGPNPSGVIVTAEDEAMLPYLPAPPRWSLAGELKALFWGEDRTTRSSGGLRVRLSLPSPRWQAGDPHCWPQELKRLDAEGAALLDRWLTEAAAVPPEIAGEVAIALNRCVDLCVTRHVGGTAAAQSLIAATRHRVRAGIAEAGRVPLAAPHLPDDLGLLPGTGFAEAWDIFQDRCRRIPNWQAALTAGAAWGSLVISASLPLGILFGIGWIGAGAGLLIGGILYGRRLGNLKRLADYLRQCLEAKFGQRLLEYAERAAGSETSDGVYQAVLHCLDTVEEPAIAGFAEARRVCIARARQESSLPTLGGTEEYLLDLHAASDLHALLHRTLTPDHLADQARTLLRSVGLFDAWRAPDWDEIAHTVTHRARRESLHSWERPFKDLGTFIRDLSGDSFSYPLWIRQRLDQMAMRAMLLALRPPTHLERDNAGEEAEDLTAGSVTLVRAAVPASLAWSALLSAPGDPISRPEGVDRERLPRGTAAADLADWYGGDLNASHVHSLEADSVSCLVLTTGLTAAQALAAIMPAPTDSASTTPEGDYNALRNGHANGNGAALAPLGCAPLVRLGGEG